jgi:hypothetical protein
MESFWALAEDLRIEAAEYNTLKYLVLECGPLYHCMHLLHMLSSLSSLADVPLGTIPSSGSPAICYAVSAAAVSATCKYVAFSLLDLAHTHIMKSCKYPFSMKTRISMMLVM